MEDYNDAKETEDDEKDSEIDIDNDYLLNEGHANTFRLYNI